MTDQERKYTKPKFNSGWFKHQKTGAENPNWKGNKAKHSGLHCWIREHFTPESKCEICKRDNDGSTLFDWSNKDHKYSRDRNDWQHVCRKCHINYDIKHNVVKPGRKK